MALDREIDLSVASPLIAEPLSSVRAPGASDAKCTQCGKSMRYMPIFLKNITCRDCYGLERYGRAPQAMTLPDRTLSTSTPDSLVHS